MLKIWKGGCLRGEEGEGRIELSLCADFLHDALKIHEVEEI